jgi:hypothetical protein
MLIIEKMFKKSLTHYNDHVLHVFVHVMQQVHHKLVVSVMNMLQTITNDSLSNSGYLNNDSCSKILIGNFLLKTQGTSPSF